MNKIHGDRILLQIYKTPQTSTFILPDEDDHVVNGEVLNISTEITKFKIGDKVMYEKHLSLPIRFEGKDLFILRESDIIMTI